jgi:hypothetical protein
MTPFYYSHDRNFKTTTCNCISYDCNFKTMTRNCISYDCNFKTTTCNCISYDRNFKTTTCNYISYDCNFKTTTRNCISYDCNFKTTTCNCISYDCIFKTTTYDNHKLKTADSSQPTLQAHLYFSNEKADAKNVKEPAIFPCNQPDKTVQNISVTDLPAPNSTFAIGGVSCSADSLVVAESFVLRIKFSGKNPAHRKSEKR